MTMMLPKSWFGGFCWLGRNFLRLAVDSSRVEAPPSVIWVEAEGGWR